MGHLAEAKEVDYGLLMYLLEHSPFDFIYLFLNNNIQEQLQLKTLKMKN